MYDKTSADSIISFAKKLINQTLRTACDSHFEEDANKKDKGNYGKNLEKFYFKYEPNSSSDPDFKEAGLELKSSPLKKLKNGDYRSKERLVLNIINYLEVHKETFDSSSFFHKNAHLLLVFYLHDKSINFLDYKIKLVGDWRYPNDDLKIIKRDWEIINQKVKEGKAHQISEGDTFYLGACTKGSTSEKSLRPQPFSSEKAKQRAYSLKQGYVNHIIASIAGEDKHESFGKIITNPTELNQKGSIEDLIISKFKPFYFKSSNQIEKQLKLNLNKKSKNYFSNITNAILGIDLKKKVEEFEKANIRVKTVRLKANNLPKEDISFPSFKYNKFIHEAWEDSNFKEILESKFFFVFYQLENSDLILRKVQFWNMPFEDIQEAKKVWDITKKLVSSGEIVKLITNKGVRKTHFPKKTENKIAHVRPHARDKNDAYELPFADKLTGAKEYTKHCFWLNAKYVQEEIYEK